jgi:hypothetical protein
MKKFASLIFLLIAGFSLHAQLHLQITNITGFPADTSYEAGLYNVQLTLLNPDTTDFIDSLGLDILLQANANSIDTLYADSAMTPDTLFAQATKNLNRNNYQFLPSHFDDGDNIVVVWPVARMTGQSGDSTSFHIYFISVNASVPKIEKQTITLYPNPVSEYISLGIPEGIPIKQVRILDVLGKEIYLSNLPEKLIPTDNLAGGIYFFEIIKADGTSTIFKILKQ